MGLDNGLILRVRHALDFDEMKMDGEMPYFLNFEELKYGVEEGFHEYEICYWRKWWGFRNDVVNALDMPINDGHKELNIGDVETIRNIMMEWLAGDNGSDISTIWSFDELIPQMGWDIVRLSWLLRYMEENAGKCIVEFYDSY